MRRSSWLIAFAATACGGGGDAGGSPGDGSGFPGHRGSVLELHAEPSRAGAYIDAAFTTAAAATLHLDTTFTAKYSGDAYAQALYLDRGGARDLVIAATEANQVTAFDPTGTPVIDATSSTLYLDAMIRENNAAHHRIFALSVDDGSTRSGWPVDVATAVKGTTPFVPAPQNQ